MKAPASAVPASSGGMKSLARLIKYARPYRLHFAAVLVLVLIYNATTVVQPWLVKVAIDADLATARPNVHGLVSISLLYVGTVIVGVAANYTQILLLQSAGQRVIRAIRIDLFAHIESQAMAFFDRNAVGRLVTNVSSDTETVSQFFTQFFLSMVRDGLSIVMIVFAMFRLDVRIATYSMVVVPVIFAIAALFRTRLRDAYQTTRTRLSNMVAFLAENLAGMRITQIFHQEARQARAFQSLNESHRTANTHEYGVSVLFNRMFELLGNVAVAGVVWIGGGAYLKHGILFGTLYAFITYIRQFFQPINSVTQQWNTLQSATVAADRIGTVFAETPAIRDPVGDATSVDPATAMGRVEFRHVSFAYKEGEPVLNDISFAVEPGAFVGFVGATGAGKSSVMSLLARFYEPSSGDILLDGQMIDKYRQSDLRRIIGLVQQEANLFTGTVLDNIRLFRDDITREAVLEAAERVGAHAIIARLPQGYDTVLRGRGLGLSMGERQLISFARTVLMNPRVLILDEATANLDSQTEELVQNGLLTVAQSRTTLVIAHRLSTVRYASRIVVLDKGCIVEQGTHEELIELRGLYASLWEKSGIEYESGGHAHPSREKIHTSSPGW